MNRFTVVRDKTRAFEVLWQARDSHLKDMAGPVQFQMPKELEAKGGIRLNASHSVLASKEACRAWPRFDSFRVAHKNVGSTAKHREVAPTFDSFSVTPDIAAE
ncbi:MAG: antibiotic biosynthesis monooxygenase [Pseudomonadota bacterium]